MSLPGCFLVAAGGTGGHVYPALAVARALQERGHRVEWAGTERDLEARVVPAAGIPLHTLSTRGVRGKNLWQTLVGMVLLLWSLVQALLLLRRVKPDVVVGMGGYVTGPVGLMAWLLRRPLLIQEQNAVAGTTNRLLAPLARRIVAGFPGAFKDRDDVLELGNPLRAELMVAAGEHPWQYHGERPLRMLVAGGSLGARPINDLLPGVVRSLLKECGNDALQVWHQTGAAQEDAVRQAYGQYLDKGVRVAPFIDDMAAAYAWADLVLCRAGALTVAELAVMGRPALLIPLPHAIDDHQTRNARALTDAGGGLLLRQSEISAASLQQILQGYLDNPQRLAAMARAAKSAGRPEATRQVADCCEELLHD